MSAEAAVSERQRYDMLWRRKMISPQPMKKLQFSDTGGFAWRPRQPNLRDLALSMGEDAVATVYADAPGKRGWGATLGDRFIQGKRPRWLRAGGINCEELWVLRRSLESRGGLLAGERVLVQMDNSAAVSYANYGAGRAPHLTLLARDAAEREVAIGRAVVAFHIASKDNAVADAMSRFSILFEGWALPQNVSFGKGSAARSKSSAGRPTMT